MAGGGGSSRTRRVVPSFRDSPIGWASPQKLGVLEVRAAGFTWEDMVELWWPERKSGAQTRGTLLYQSTHRKS
ncbi:unnamed protein product [Linum trigynum]